MAASPCWVAPQQLAAICTYAPAVFWFVSTAAALLSTQLGRLAALTSYGRALDTDNSKVRSRFCLFSTLISAFCIHRVTLHTPAPVMYRCNAPLKLNYGLCGVDV